MIPNSTPKIVPFKEDYRHLLLKLAQAAWAPVFDAMKDDVPDFVYRSFYPNGWRDRQVTDIGSLLKTAEVEVWVMFDGAELIGFVGYRIAPEDRMGVIEIVAVAPTHQRRGLGRRLMEFAERRISEAGMAMVMVETGDDGGHSAARAAYLKLGYVRWPVARYFKPLIR